MNAPDVFFLFLVPMQNMNQGLDGRAFGSPFVQKMYPIARIEGYSPRVLRYCAAVARDISDMFLTMDLPPLESAIA